MKLLHHQSRAQGSSLIIVLIFVVLLTGVVAVFLTRNEANIQSSRNSANGMKADVFCRGAVDTLIGQLKQEIVDGSTPITQGTTTVYLPMTSGVRQNLMPYPVNINPVNNAICTIPTVVKVSLYNQPF